MKFPFVTRATYEAALGRSEYAREALVDTSIVNDHLTDTNLAVARRLTRALRACQRYRAELAAERQRTSHLRRRADRLQRRLDEAVGLGPRRIEDSSQWQPAHKAPKEGAS